MRQHLRLEEAGGGNIYAPICLDNIIADYRLLYVYCHGHGVMVSRVVHDARVVTMDLDAEFGIRSNSKNKEEWSGLRT